MAKYVEEAVAKIVTELIAGKDLELVAVEYVKERDWYLRVFIDKAGGIEIDDCQELSEQLEEVLDAKNIIADSYILEVSSPGLDRVLKAHGWERFFDVTRAADETASKPDPLMLNQILAHCDMRPEQALMVGDASFDLLMARSAGIDSVAVSYGAQSIERLRDFDPVLEVDHFPELRGWLEARAHSRLC